MKLKKNNIDFRWSGLILQNFGAISTLN